MTDARRIEGIATGFCDYFRSRSYVVHPAEPLIPQEDASLAFTNSTIVPLKRYLFEGFAPPGFAVVQPCIRLRALEQDSYDGPFTSFFRMAGILAHPDVSLAELRADIAGYLDATLGLQKDRISLQYSDDTEDLLGAWRDAYPTVRGAFNDSYYQWTYGMRGVRGRGVTFCVATQHGLKELGNFVEMSREGRVIGYEFGFGIESCIAILDGYPDNFTVLFEGSLERKLADLTATAAVAEAACAVAPRVPGTTRSSLKKLERALARTIERSGQRDLAYLARFEWSIVGVSSQDVERLAARISARLAGNVRREELLAAYRAYLGRMRAQGRTDGWVNGKLAEYVRTHHIDHDTG